MKPNSSQFKLTSEEKRDLSTAKWGENPKERQKLKQKVIDRAEERWADPRNRGK